MAYKIIIYDDNEMLRTSIAALLNISIHFEVMAAFANPLEVITDLDTFKPDVLLMDIDMPEMTGVQAVQKIRNANINVPIIMLTVFEDNENIYNAICAGASGYLLKKANPDSVALAILDVLDGGAPMTSSIAKKVLQLFLKIPNKKSENTNMLSPRELEILQYLQKGYSYKMIAAEIFISYETVRTHIKNIYKKMQVNSATEAIAKARE